MPLGTDSTRLPPTHHHRLRPGVTCTPRPGSPSPWTAHRYMHNEHRHIVVLLVTCEHTVNEVLEKPFGPGQHVRIGTPGHRRQFLESPVEATIPVLPQAIQIKKNPPARRGGWKRGRARRGRPPPGGVPAST